jgi:alkyl hydroperoxide reductase subunit AhpF
MFDLIIIGASAAGCAAAIYSARRKLNFKIVTDDIGGEVALSGVVNNWPGIIEIQGFELAKKFHEHVKSYGVEIDQGYRVEKITSENNYHIITTKNATGEEKTYQTKAVIIATGIHPRHLQVPGENTFNRKGVTYCTVCDGPLFKNKITTTVGSGNSALESALMMAGIAKKVYLLSKFSNTAENNFGFPKGENILIDKVKTLPNVEIIYGAKTTEIIGEKTVTGLKYNVDGKTETLETNGVMVHIGQIPNSQFIDSVNKNKVGEIMVDGKCQTNVPGIFAAGDVTDVAYKQIGISAGQGIISALATIEYLNRFK